jgi:hypothetical protein
LFIAGGLMGMHYKFSQDIFNQCPTPVAVGPNDTGKTTSAKFFLSIVGRLNTGLARQLTVAEASSKNTLSTIPIVFDDPDNISDVKAMVNNTFNEQERSNRRDTLIPRTIAMFTMNEDKIHSLLDNFRYFTSGLRIYCKTPDMVLY